MLLAVPVSYPYLVIRWSLSVFGYPLELIRILRHLIEYRIVIRGAGGYPVVPVLGLIQPVCHRGHLTVCVIGLIAFRTAARSASLLREVRADLTFDLRLLAK